MPKVDLVKTSFAGGEFGDSLAGRTDIAQYANACEIVENFLIRPFGSAISTPGTRYVSEVKTSSKRTRLIRFVFNRSDSYVIEMGEYYFRFYTNGAVVVTTGTTPFELAHTFTESELFDVQFCQLNDVVWMSHPSHVPQKLTRTSASNWKIEDFAFLGGPFLDDNTNTATTINVSATAGTVNLVVSPTNANLFVPSTSTLGHVNTYWKIGGVLTNSTTDLEVQGYVKITNVVNSYTATASVIKMLTLTGATDDWAEGAWSSVRGYPACVTFHESRLFFARTSYEPQGVWGSKSFIYDDFSLNSQNDDDGINIKLASNESNQIQWLASGKALIAGTYGGAFVINGGTDTGITPSNVSSSQEVSWGADEIIPKRIGNFFYYIQRFGKKLRELFYFWDLDTYKSMDKTILSPHILGDGVVDMAYQENPDTILYCVRTDGTLATLTREVDQEVQAWSRQTTDGYYESVTSIPSQTEPYDEVWVVVKRTINGDTKRYVEVFEDIEIPDRQDLCFYLHSGLTYNAYDATSSPTATNISLSVTSGTSCVVTTSAAYFSASDVGQRIRAIDSEGVTLGELEIIGYTSSTVVIGEIKYDFSAPTYSSGYWGLSVNTISGLDHLEAAEIKVLADGGMDRPDKTVSAGTITLASDYFIVSVGLPYTQKLYTLPFEAGSAKGTAQGKVQRINQVGFKVNRSYKGFKTGGTEDLAEQINFRDPSTLMGTPELLYTGVIPNIFFKDDYRYGSQVMVINEDPLPVELLSIMVNLETHDK
jgi:hypothetical protein